MFDNALPQSTATRELTVAGDLTAARESAATRELAVARELSVARESVVAREPMAARESGARESSVPRPSPARLAAPLPSGSPGPRTSVSPSGRLTRRRSSAGPVPPSRPQRPAVPGPGGRGSVRPTFLTLRDHGKVYVADLPRLSDGQLAHVAKEAREVLESLNRRLEELEAQPFLAQTERDTRIRAATKRDVTERFIRAINEEQDQRRNNPALRAAAGESLARVFLEVARHRLPGATFDSLLQEALSACGPEAEGAPMADPEAPHRSDHQALPVVLTPEP